MQGYDKSVLEAIYHVVEHFSLHTGQIIYATKLFAKKISDSTNICPIRSHREDTLSRCMPSNYLEMLTAEHIERTRHSRPGGPASNAVRAAA